MSSKSLKFLMALCKLIKLKQRLIEKVIAALKLPPNSDISFIMITKAICLVTMVSEMLIASISSLALSFST